MTTPSLSRSTAVRNTPLVTQRTCRLKMISMLSGRPMSRLSAARASKNARACRGAVKVMVLATPALAHGDVLPVAGLAVVAGERQRQPGPPALGEHLDV